MLDERHNHLKGACISPKSQTCLSVNSELSSSQRCRNYSLRSESEKIREGQETNFIGGGMFKGKKRDWKRQDERIRKS